MEKLLKKCSEFYKLAQQKPNPNKKQIELYSKVLHHALGDLYLFLPNPNAAKTVFDSVAAYKEHLSAAGNPYITKIEMILTGITESEAKLKSFGLDPVKVLINLGMKNVNPNILNIIKNNLNTLLEGKDFSKYQHYFLFVPGEGHSKDMIDLDYDPKDAGY